MPTLPRQDRLRSSGDDVNQLLPAGPSLENQPHLLGDLNAIRSQLRRIIRHVSDSEEWYENPVGGGAGGGGSGGVETVSNKRMPARATTADGQLACNIGITEVPIGASYVGVRVNGVDISELGDGTKVGCACFFSNDGGASARAWADITQGDALYWNGSVAGFELAVSDTIDFVYES